MRKAKIPFLQKLWSVIRYRPLLLVGLLDACAYFAYGAFEIIFPLLAVLKSTIAMIPLILIYGLGFALITASTSALGVLFAIAAAGCGIALVWQRRKAKLPQ